MHEALRSVIMEINVATKTRPHGAIDLRIQKGEDEVGRLPDPVAAEVSVKAFQPEERRETVAATEGGGQLRRDATTPCLNETKSTS